MLNRGYATVAAPANPRGFEDRSCAQRKCPPVAHLTAPVLLFPRSAILPSCCLRMLHQYTPNDSSKASARRNRLAGAQQLQQEDPMVLPQAGLPHVAIAEIGPPYEEEVQQSF